MHNNMFLQLLGPGYTLRMGIYSGTPAQGGRHVKPQPGGQPKSYAQRAPESTPNTREGINSTMRISAYPPHGPTAISFATQYTTETEGSLLRAMLACNQCPKGTCPLREAGSPPEHLPTDQVFQLLVVGLVELLQEPLRGWPHRLMPLCGRIK